MQTGRRLAWPGAAAPGARRRQRRPSSSSSCSSSSSSSSSSSCSSPPASRRAGQSSAAASPGEVLPGCAAVPRSAPAVLVSGNGATGPCRCSSASLPLHYLLPLIRVYSGATGNPNYCCYSLLPPSADLTPTVELYSGVDALAGGSSGRLQEYLEPCGTHAGLFFRDNGISLL